MLYGGIMKKSAVKKISFNKSAVMDVLKSAIIALIISLIGVLLLGLCIKLFEINSKLYLPINQVIKIFSIIGGCFLGFKYKENGAMKGGLVGIIYTVLSILVFGIIESAISFNAFNWFDLIAGAVAGIVSGIIVVNVRKKGMQ